VESVTANNLDEDEINSRHLEYTGLRPRPAGASAGYNNIMIEVEGYVQVVEQFEFGVRREQSSSNRICP
jgi:hypothetical protein